MSLRTKVVLFLIVVLAGLLRLFSLGENPAGFFCDEASIGYDAYQIWHTGYDSHGHRFPVFFESFGDYKNPVFVYSMSPVVGFLGLSQNSVRLTSATYGLLTVLVIFFYVKEVFDVRTALVSSFLLAISPWHVFFSRIGFELISAVFWTVFSLYLLEKSFQNILIYPLAAISLSVSFLSYTTPKLFLPPLILFFALTHFPKIFKFVKKPFFWLTNIAVVLALVLLLFPFFENGTFFSRWHQVTQNPLTFSQTVTAYFNHFSLDFLFVKGDIDFPGEFITRHSVRGVGELYWFQLPFLILFFVKLVFSKKDRSQNLFILSFLAVYPLGTIFTQVNPLATRSIIGVIPFQIASAVGLVYLYQLLFYPHLRRLLLIILLFLIPTSLLNFYHLLENYPQYSSDFWGWQYGAAPVMNYFLKNKDNYQQFCLEGAFNAPDIFPKFYDPTDLCTGKCQVCGTNDFDPSKKQLFAITPDTLRDYPALLPGHLFLSQQIINYPNGSPAFIIGEFK